MADLAAADSRSNRQSPYGKHVGPATILRQSVGVPAETVVTHSSRAEGRGKVHYVQVPLGARLGPLELLHVLHAVREVLGERRQIGR